MKRHPELKTRHISNKLSTGTYCGWKEERASWVNQHHFEICPQQRNHFGFMPCEHIIRRYYGYMRWILIHPYLIHAKYEFLEINKLYTLIQVIVEGSLWFAPKTPWYPFITNFTRSCKKMRKLSYLAFWIFRSYPLLKPRSAFFFRKSFNGCN